MIRELVNSSLNELLEIHIIKKYVVKTSNEETFKVENATLLIITSGTIKIQFREIIQVLTGRDVMIIPKDSFCKIPEVQGRLQLLLIMFSPQFPFRHSVKKEIVKSFYFFMTKSPVKITLEEKEYVVIALISKLIYFTNNEGQLNDGELELKRMSFNLLIYKLQLMYSKHIAEVTIPYTRNESLVIQFLITVAAHSQKEHHVQFYADALFVTPAYLNKIVKAVTGKTVKGLIMETIIIEAKNLLEESCLSIGEISEVLHFTSIYSFSTVFKAHTSFSPIQYRCGRGTNKK